MANKEVRVPSLRISRVLETRSKISKEVMSRVLGKKLVGDDFTSFVHDIHSQLKGVAFSPVYRSLQHLAGVLITDKECDEVSWRIAGNIHHLRKGIVIPPWTRQLFKEWVPIQIMAVQRSIDYRNLSDNKAKTQMRVCKLDTLFLAGLQAGRRVIKEYPEHVIMNSRIRVFFGFDKRYNRYGRNIYDAPKENVYPLHSVIELTKLRTYVLLDPNLPEIEQGFVQMKGTPQTNRYNRKVIAMRTRKEFQCMMNYDVQVRPCYSCEVGYDKCAAGCHPYSYVQGTCAACQHSNRYMDPSLSLTICVNCLTNGKDKEQPK
jgi:hypothetical protein